MCRTACASALGLALVGLVAPRAAHALPLEQLQAHVPFAFHIGGVALPAGDYVIEQARSANQDLLVIRSSDGRRTVFFYVQNVSPWTTATTPELVFERRGEEQLLHSIAVPKEGWARIKIPAAKVNSAR